MSARRPAAHGRGGRVDRHRCAAGRDDRGARMPRATAGPAASTCASCRRRARSPSPPPMSPWRRADAPPRSTCSRTTGRRTRSPARRCASSACAGSTTACPTASASSPSADRSTLTVDVAPGAAPVNTTLQYQVADATDDPSRYAWGTVTISVQDRPDPVTGAQVTGFGDGTLDVAFGAGGFNNSPITGYEIALVDPAGSTVLTTSTCAATTCTVPTPGNGQANAVLRSRAGPQRDRALRPRRGAGTDLVRRDPAAAAGPQGAAARRPAPDRVGARRHRCGQPGRVVRGHGGGRLERGGRRGRMHGLRVRHRVAGHRERQPGAVHGERAQPGLPGPRHVDRGRRQRHAVRAADRGRHHRHGRRRGRCGHGVVGPLQRQRRRDRRLLRAAAGRRPDRDPLRSAGLLGDEPGPGRRRRLRRAAAASPRSSRSGRMPRACSSPAR